MSENRNGRPTSAKVEAASVSDGNLDTVDGTRCTRCGHRLHAVESVRLELGPVCRRLVSDEVAA